MTIFLIASFVAEPSTDDLKSGITREHIPERNLTVVRSVGNHLRRSVT